MFHQSNIRDLQKKSWRKYRAACVWKTTLSPDTQEYKTTVRMAEILLEEWFWVIHGWYEDGKWWGTMQAYAHWANNIIMRDGLSSCCNIWVPEERFDLKWWVQDRTKHNTTFCDPLPHMDPRCGVIVDACHVMVVNEFAWNWTLREVFTMYERNDIHKPSNLGEWAIKPIIFYGDNWKNLFTLLDAQFKIGTPLSQDENLFFVNNLEDFHSVLLVVKSRLL